MRVEKSALPAPSRITCQTETFSEPRKARLGNVFAGKEQLAGGAAVSVSEQCLRVSSVENECERRRAEERSQSASEPSLILHHSRNKLSPVIAYARFAFFFLRVNSSSAILESLGWHLTLDANHSTLPSRRLAVRPRGHRRCIDVA